MFHPVFFLDVVMIEHEAHPVAVPVDAADARSEGCDQFLHACEQTFARTVRFRCPQSRSIKFRLGLYAGSQKILIRSELAANHSRTACV